MAQNPFSRPFAAALLLAALATGQAAPAPAPAPAAAPVPIDRLLVCNKAADSLSIVDPATRTELAVLPTGQGPHEVAVAPDGRTAVVADYGGQLPGRTLTVVDVAAAKVLRTIALGETVPGDGNGAPARRIDFLRPHGCRFVDATHVLVTSEAARRLLLVDLAADRVERSWPTPQRTMHMVALSPDHRTAFATSVGDGNVAVFDLTAAAAPRLVPTGDGAEGLAVAPDTGEAWVANRQANTLAVVDPRTGKVAATLPTGDLPFRVAFARGGALVLVPCAEAGEVHLFDAAKRQLLAAVPISGDGSELSPLPMGIVVDPDDRFAYVACGRGEFVAVLDLQLRRVVDRIVARAGPDGLGFARIAPAAR